MQGVGTNVIGDQLQYHYYDASINVVVLLLLIMLEIRCFYSL